MDSALFQLIYPALLDLSMHTHPFALALQRHHLALPCLCVLSQVDGSYAEQRKKVAGLNQRLGDCVLPGDILRAVSVSVSH